MVQKEEQQTQQRQHFLEEKEQWEEEAAGELRQLQATRGELCRTIDELYHAEEAAELALTCLQCTKLFKDPHIITPCGHTLCAACCGVGKAEVCRTPEEVQGVAGAEALQDAGPGRGAEPDGDEAKSSTPQTTPVCRLCDKDAREGAGAGGVAPNRAVATLLGKFTFRRQLLETIRNTSVVSWQEGLRNPRE